MTTIEKLQKLYTELQGANIEKYVDQKNTGKTKLDYLSWGAAVDFFTKGCHALGLDWTYSHRFIDMGTRGAFVETTVTVFDAENGETVEKIMSLPCMTLTNQAAKDADVMNINKTQMRALVKCFTLFGLGLKLYLKDFSELDEVKMASSNKQDELEKKIAIMRQRIKTMLDKLPPETDVSQFADYAACDDVERLTAIGIAVKKKYCQGC
jgi:hypothetical protein